ncbi:hypothetical protein [Paraburkholderia sp. BL21I4N1]|uniref:hypothetical protein n=1 Tax=Paraburkholderia sp. BL21I4N1 TaxID=1938801 RepID=UPI000CFD875D|nr:hypothetical protein [Paraburkholderia sp. BL21I4N1]PQV47629.1 hypothetical protein B0G83_110178 [Paraburkholderia sp. BL21I4N1]
MDRRTFMTSGAWLSSAAAGGAWPSLVHADARRHTLAIVDTSMAHGLAVAEYASRLKLPLFEPGDDIGALWYTTLAPLLDERTSLLTQPSLIGLTRASDYFVLKQLAIRAGYRVEARGERSTASISRLAYVAFTFTAHPQR